jgi:hypothetical protein
VEIKWSDKPYKSHSELDNSVEFASKNPLISQQPILVTSRSISFANIDYKGFLFNFIPSSLYAYKVGANLLKYLDSVHQ